MPWEIRWFSHEMNNYGMVLNWFKSIDNILQTETRTDQYVLSPASEDLGIKLRNYSKKNKRPPILEIKWRRSQSTSFHSPENRIVGIVEEWVKWAWSGYPVESNDKKIDFFAELPDGPGIIIKKIRYLRRYKFLSKEMKSTMWINKDQEGLGCEITQISAHNEEWWSLGFEGIGSINEKIKFQSAVTSVLQDFPLSLQRENSFGYPFWIQKIFKDTNKPRD